MIVRVKPLNLEKKEWSSYKGPRYKKAKHILTVYYNKAGTLITGLTKNDEERLGKELDRDLRNTSSFWDNFQIVMTDKDLLLNTENPEEELKYLVLKSHFQVKKSKFDENPYAKYEIFDELENAKVINNEADILVKAFKLYAELSLDAKRNILKLYPGYVNTMNVNPDIIESNLFLKVKEDPKKFVNLVEDKNKDSKILLRDLVAAKILTKNKTAYKYGTDFLGHNEEATIDFLNNPENQSLKITLIQELEGTKKGK